MISNNYNSGAGHRFSHGENYVEVVHGKTRKARRLGPEEKLCSHLKPAIHADGMDKGRLVKICADPTCKIHFGNRQQEEKQRLAWIEERKSAGQKRKQTVALRHRDSRRSASNV